MWSVVIECHFVVVVEFAVFDVVKFVVHFRPVAGAFRCAIMFFTPVIGFFFKCADEIERLRNMLAHGLVFGSTCEGCLICEQLKEVHEQTLREIALENQTNG